MANEVVVSFTGQADKLNRTIDSVEGKVGKLQNSIASGSQKIKNGVGKVAKGAAVLSGAGVLAVGAFGLKAVEAGEALNSIRSQTEAVVKSTKGVANVSTKHVKNYANELSNLAAVDRKVIEGSENVLLTFTNVRNEVGKGNKIFDQASLAALDMSSALGTDLQSATIQVGKALNDPIKGVSALSEAGIQFTEQQKEQIETMVKAGDTLGAQKIILGELSTQFEGSAAANADASDKIKLAFGRIAEAIGLKLLPYLDIFADWTLNTGIPALESFSTWLGDEVSPKIQDVAGWVGDNLVPYLQDLGNWLNDTGIPALESFAGWLSENTDVIEAVAIGVTAALVPAFIAWAAAAAVAAAATIVAIAPVVLVGAAVALLAYLIIHYWDDIVSATKRAWGWVKDTVTDAWNSVWNTTKDILSSIDGSIRDAISGFISLFKSMVDSIETVFSGIVGAIVRPFTDAAQGVKNAWNRLLGGKGFSVPDWVPGIGGKSFRIPKLAKGGIILPRVGGTPFVGGEAGQAEAIIPLDRLAGMISGNMDSNGLVVNNYIQGSIVSERDIRAIVADALRTAGIGSLGVS